MHSDKSAEYLGWRFGVVRGEAKGVVFDPGNLCFFAIRPLRFGVLMPLLGNDRYQLFSGVRSSMVQ